jgi:hypothetical protein
MRNICVALLWLASKNLVSAHDPKFFLYGSDQSRQHIRLRDADDFAKSWAIYHYPDCAATTWVLDASNSNYANTRGLLYVELLLPTTQFATCDDIDITVSRRSVVNGSTAMHPVAVQSQLPACNQCSTPRRRVALPLHCCNSAEANRIMYEPYGMTELQSCAFVRGQDYETLESLSPLHITVTSTTNVATPPYVLVIGCGEDNDFWELGFWLGWYLDRLFFWSTGHLLTLPTLLVSCFVLYKAVSFGILAADGQVTQDTVSPLSQCVTLRWFTQLLAVILWSRFIIAFSLTDCSGLGEDRNMSTRLTSFVGFYAIPSALIIALAGYVNKCLSKWKSAHAIYRVYIASAYGLLLFVSMFSSGVTSTWLFVGSVLLLAAPFEVYLRNEFL